MDPEKGENELSPSGLLAATRIIYDVVSKNPSENLKFLVSNNLLASLISVLDSTHLQRLQDW
jgi:hypothetical protein